MSVMSFTKRKIPLLSFQCRWNRKSVSIGKDVLRVAVKPNLGEAVMVMTEEIVGEIMLILVGLRVSGEAGKQRWL